MRDPTSWAAGRDPHASAGSMDRPTPGRACLPGWAAVRFLTNRSTEEEHIEAFRARQMDRLRARLSRGVSTSGHGTSSRLRLPDVSAHSRTGKQVPEPTDPLPSRRLLVRPRAGERARQSPRGPGRPDPEPERAGQPPGECAGSAAVRETDRGAGGQQLAGGIPDGIYTDQTPAALRAGAPSSQAHSLTYSLMLRRDPDEISVEPRQTAGSACPDSAALPLDRPRLLAPSGFPKRACRQSCT